MRVTRTTELIRVFDNTGKCIAELLPSDTIIVKSLDESDGIIRSSMLAREADDQAIISWVCDAIYL
jgi:hypothetical protein